MPPTYDFAAIEPRWQKVWQELGLFRASEEPGDDYYCLMMYPYPSGALHMGHVINYTIGDVLVRYALMHGKTVLSPMGWDSFGLPAENAAIRAGVHPREWTARNIDKMRAQMVRAGWGYDWSTELATHHPGYHRWTQWLFIQFYRKGLAFKKRAPVNWCPSCMTVLANEQVSNEGKCERCASAVEPKDLEQWFFRMSAYAERLLAGHDRLRGKWPERVLKMQEEWIGRSEGARIDFTIDAPGSSVHGDRLPIFTTRPDTIYGVTFMALAPEHPMIAELVKGTGREKEVLEAAARMRKVSAIERTDETSEKEGVPTGRRVVNPYDGSKSEIWVTNYALMEYGTGAVMAVPAHDTRDFMFARKYGIPVRLVIQPPGEVLDPETMEDAYIEDGTQVSSGKFDGLPNREAIGAMTRHAKANGFGGSHVNYRLKDWLVSRQRYWGAPIPVLYCEKCGEQVVPEEDLPVLLPDGIEFKPTGESPLASHAEFVEAKCPKCGGPARRETDTMDTFVDSSWYFLRYLTPRKEDAAFDMEAMKRWMPVHQYVGGIEHATMHLIYARFFTMVLYDLGLCPVEEPFERLFCQGMVTMPAYRCDEHLWLGADEVDKDSLTCRHCGKHVASDVYKMSKTKKNVVPPDELIDRYGADTVHTYILSTAPPDRDTLYSEQNVVGIHRFLFRFWEAVVSRLDGLPPAGSPAEPTNEDDRALRRKAHQTIGSVTDCFDVKELKFNVAIARIMELVNAIRDSKEVSGSCLREALEAAVRLLAPFAPHMTEELWAMLGHASDGSVFKTGWPALDEAAAAEDEIEIPVQVNGKLRGKIVVPAGTAEDAIREKALAAVEKHTSGKDVKKVIVVGGAAKPRLVSAVVK